MLSTTLGFPGDMSRRSVLALVFPKGCFCESGLNNLFKNFIENMK